jgi:hypothetical protein
LLAVLAGVRNRPGVMPTRRLKWWQNRLWSEKPACAATSARDRPVSACRSCLARSARRRMTYWWGGSPVADLSCPPSGSRRGVAQSMRRHPRADSAATRRDPARARTGGVPGRAESSTLRQTEGACRNRQVGMPMRSLSALEKGASRPGVLTSVPRAFGASSIGFRGEEKPSSTGHLVRWRWRSGR